MEERFERIPISSLHPSKTNPRKTFDKKKMDELIESIREKDIVVPILVRLVKEPNEGQYEVVAGERRYRSALALKMKDVPCIVRDLNDDQALEIQVIENLQREDVHPLEEAEGFTQLINSGKHTAESIAGKVGKSITWVHQTLKLNALIPEIKQKFLEGFMNRTHAVYLSRYSTAIQKEAYSRNIKGQREFNFEWVKNNIDRLQVNLSSGPFRKDDATLVPAAGPCTTCPKRSGFAPELFPDVKKSDLCFDTDCFAKKCKATAAQKIEEMEEKGLPIVAIQGTYGPRIKTGLVKDVLERGNFDVISDKQAKKDKTAVMAIVTESDDAEDIGRTVFIKKHKQSSSGYSAPKIKRPSKAELFKRRIEREAQKLITRQILEKANTPQLPQAVYAFMVEEIAAGYLSGAEQDYYEQYLGYRGGHNLKAKIHNPKTSIGELHRIALTQLMFDTFQSGKVMDEFAKLLKVDAAAIRKTVKQQLEAAQKAKDTKKKK